MLFMEWTLYRLFFIENNGFDALRGGLFRVKKDALLDTVKSAAATESLYNGCYMPAAL